MHDDVIRRSRVEIMEAKLIRNDTVIKRLTNQILDMQAHSMKNNIIFTFDKKSRYFCQEADGEKCTAIVRHFLVSVLGVQAANDFYIPVAHRVGMRRSSGARSILATFAVASEISMVMANANRLKNTTHYLNRQIPAAMRERNQHAMSEFKEKRQNQANGARLINGKLYVKGCLQIKYLPPVLPTVDATDDDLPDITIAESDQITDSGSIFKGHAAVVKNPDDCAAPKSSTLLMPRSHIHRAPHDCSCPVQPGGLPWILETTGLPCEFNFCGVCGHIFYDVRAVPFTNWKSLIIRRP